MARGAACLAEGSAVASSPVHEILLARSLTPRQDSKYLMNKLIQFRFVVSFCLVISRLRYN